VIRGLVIGRFYPPHRGHQFLIDTALAQVDHLDVLICSRPEQAIPGELRRQWLAEMHPRARVQAIADPGEDDNSEFWADYTVQILGRAPDVVFSSEDYGPRLAHFLACRHVMVDRERKQVPISARAILAAPLAHWEFLAPCVRAHFAKRVSVVGAESTGKTKLARALAEHYETLWVPEYAREYCQNLYASGVDLWTYPWRSEEFIEIARRQQAMEDRLAREANRILFCDTDVLATGVWHERYLHTGCPQLESRSAACRHDLYLLTDVDVPFVQDGFRDGEAIRPWMSDRFEQVLTERRARWVRISGWGAKRFDRARAEVDKLLA
jgi:HTH-type transcriptional regulator, transcriptional repressor of NAD biosynthesis genes